MRGIAKIYKNYIEVYCKNHAIERMHLLMRGIHIFEKPCYREIRIMRGRAMRGLPVLISFMFWENQKSTVT